MSDNYKGIITALKDVRPFPGADRIKLSTCWDSQVIVGVNNTDGELGIYFPPDSKLGIEYCQINGLLELRDESGHKVGGGYLDPDKRRIRCMRMRGEKSEGLWMPINSLLFTGHNLSKLKVGDQIDELNGVKLCEKYIPRGNPPSKKLGNYKKQGKARKPSYPLFREHIDTANIKYYWNKLEPGSLLQCSLKCHGTSARSSHTLEIKPLTNFQKAVNKIVPVFKDREWKYICGTRRVVLTNPDHPSASGYYNTNDFRMEHHNKFVGKLKKGETIYYEIVGWVHGDTPIMSRCSNKELGKEFVKQYGDTTVFKYGCTQGTSDIYVYRITMTNEDGDVIEYPFDLLKRRCEQLEVKPVMELTKPFFYDGDVDALKKKVEELGTGADPIDPSHIREGVVIRIENGGKVDWLKWKSFEFLSLEGMLGDSKDAVPDMETAQDLIEGDAQ
jgi:hypothetical protein